MNPGTLLTLAILAILVASVAATAAQVLQEFWRHKLEEYCRRRGKLNWFTMIIELRLELALGATTLQMISIAMALTCGLLYFFTLRDIESVTPFGVMGLIGLWSLILLAANSWIPWGIRAIAAPSFLYRTWRLWWGVSLMLAPLTAGVEVATTLFRRATGKQKPTETDEDTFVGEIRSMVSEGEHDGLLEPDAREMIEGVFELDASVVGKVMTPRSKVDFINAKVSWKELSEIVIETGRTRLPVVNQQFNRAGDVLGVLFVKDLMAEYAKSPELRRKLPDMVRNAMIVPATKPLDDMLQQFLDERSHMAIVVDEYGSVAGVITIEDILEEIVGEIIDEKDKDEPATIVPINEQVIDVDGTVRIDQLNDEYGFGLPEDQDFDTISGLIMSSLKSVPKRGQTLNIGNLQLDIRQASRRMIERVRVTILETGHSNNDPSSEEAT